VNGDGDGDAGCASGLDESLAALKREGCAFLVAGDAGPAVHARASERFLGDGDDRRMVLLTDDAYRPGPLAGPDPAVVRYETAVRGNAVADTAGEAGGDAVATDLEALGMAVLEEVASHERTGGGFRLVVLSAAPLVAEHDDEQVFAWLHLLTGRVRQVTGMAFVHLPLDAEDTLVGTLRPLFDGLIEVRPDAGGQQRWLLEDAESDWMAL
jgi:hypothetical protein